MSKPKEKKLFSSVVSIPLAGRDSLEEAINQFHLWEMRSRDCIEVKRCYIDVAKDLEAGVLLSQIIYWHLPDKEGEQKLSVYRDGHWWLAKGRSDWWAECRLTPKQFDRAIRHLEEQQLVCAHVYKWQGQNTKHIRIDWAGLLQALSLLDASPDSVIGFRRREPVSSSLRKHDHIPRDEFWDNTDSPQLGDLLVPVEKPVVKGCPCYPEKLLPPQKISEQISSELPNRESLDSLIVNSQIPYQSSSELPNRESLDSLIVNSQIPYQSSSELPNRELHLYTEITAEITPEITIPPIPPRGNERVGIENLTFPQPEEPGTGIQPPSLTNLSNQPDSQLQPLNPHEEESDGASLIGNKTMESNKIRKNQLESLIGNETMELETVGKNQLELETRIEFRQNFDPARAQNDEAMNVIALRESSSGDEYSPRVRGPKHSLPRHSSPAAIETKIVAPQASHPAVLSHQPEQQRVTPNSFGQDEHDAVFPTGKIAAIEPSQTAPNPSQHQADDRLQTELSFHPRSVANRVQETRFDRNQADLTKNLDGSDRLPWDTNKRGVFDQAFENHMARSLMQYPAYRDLMAGELITKVRKHISAGRYDLKRRDELLIEWSAMQNPERDDFSIANSNLTAKAAARQAKILRALNMKD